MAIGHEPTFGDVSWLICLAISQNPELRQCEIKGGYAECITNNIALFKQYYKVTRVGEEHYIIEWSNNAMINANEMKKVALEKQAERHEAEELKVVSEIMKSADNGNTAVTISGKLSDYLTNKLKSNGYSVLVNNSSYQRDPTTTTISWS